MSTERILCPIDFSDYSRATLRAAVELAAPSSAEITLIHVFPSPKVGADAMAEIVTEEALASFIRDTKEKLAKMQQEAIGLGAKRVEILAVPGIPWDQIVKAAQERKIDAIVMGTHGRTGLQRALVGSVAEKVVRHAPCSVFVTRSRPS